jgi:hypothetical protein
MWDWLFPPVLQLPPLQPQIEAWTDRSHLYDVVLPDFITDPDTLPMSRTGAMRVPAVARGRNLTCGTIAKLPMSAIRTDTPVATQPYWLYGTDGQLGDLTPKQVTAWGIRPQSPFHRMLWTIDDLLFYGESLWFITSATAQAQARSLPLRMVRVPWDHWTVEDGQVVDLDNEPIPADRLVYLPGPNEGILNFGRGTIRTAYELEENARDVAKHPLRLEAHQTSAAELTPEERRDITTAVRAAMAANDGVLFTNQGIELIEHRVDSDALQLGARNASALDIARLVNMPAAMLDASQAGASLEYQTLQGRNQQWLDYGLQLYIDAVEARLSMDDIVPAGQRVAFDTADWTSPTPSPTGPPEQD